jgi:lipoprotein signal peptidase
MATEQRYWFPAKRYGWGWGLPPAWQGWVVLIAYIGLVVGGAFVLKPTEASSFGYVAYTVVLTVALLVVCWLKGEPTSWRWGK